MKTMQHNTSCIIRATDKVVIYFQDISLDIQIFNFCTFVGKYRRTGVQEVNLHS